MIKTEPTKANAFYQPFTIKFIFLINKTMSAKQEFLGESLGCFQSFGVIYACCTHSKQYIVLPAVSYASKAPSGLILLSGCNDKAMEELECFMKGLLFNYLNIQKHFNI